MKTINEMMGAVRSYLLLGAVWVVGVSTSALAVASPTYTVVLSGIDSPRGMDLDSKGNLYVASAGYGGSGTPFLLSRSVEVGPICPGTSGKVYKVTPNGQVSTVIQNLPSHANCQDFNGSFGFVNKGAVAFGPNGLKVSESNGKVTLLMSAGGSTEVITEFCLPGGVLVNSTTPASAVSCLPGFAPAFPQSLVLSQAQLWGPSVLFYNTVGQINLSDSTPHYDVTYGQMKVLEDIFNPDGVNTAGPYLFPFPTTKENDIYDLLKVNNQIFAVDAGANLIWSLQNGSASVAVVMPNVGCSKAPCARAPGVTTNLPESVPTAIAQNPLNGKIYIGELAAFNPGVGRIFQADFSTTPATLTQVNIHGSDAQGSITGLTNTVGMDFDKNGNLYMVEYADETAGYFGAQGEVLKLHFNNALDATASVFAADSNLKGPTGITIGNGKIYVGNKQDTGLHQAEVRAYNLPAN